MIPLIYFIFGAIWLLIALLPLFVRENDKINRK